MIYYKTGDLLKADATYICHQVNCRGVMGAGIAKQVKDTWPEVYNDYIKAIQNHPKCCPLGEITATKINNNQVVINMFAQDRYGHGIRFTDYEAFYKCLERIRDLTNSNSTIAFPYGIGCGLGGGDWKIIETMIQNVLKDRKVYIYKYWG